MRILLVAHGFPPSAMGGTEVYTHDLARIFRDRLGDEVFVLTREADPDRPEYEVRRETQNGVEVFFVNNTFSRCASFADTYRSPEIRASGALVIDEVRPDVAHFQHITCLSTELPAELKARGIPVLFTLNDFWLMCHRGQLLDLEMERCPGPWHGCDRCIGVEAGVGGGVYRAGAALRRLEAALPARMARRLHRLAVAGAGLLGRGGRAAAEGDRRWRHMLAMASHVTRFLAPSHTLREHFLAFGIPPEQIAHVQQGIDQSPFEGLERVVGERLRIAYLGGLLASKGPHVLLEAFAGLPEGSAELHVYGGYASYHGDDSYRAVIEPLLDQPGVHHHGSVPHEQIPAAMAATDVMVIPSTWLENAPFSIREAYVCGVPVVASDHGGMAEMVEHGVTGLRFRPGDAAALRDALLRLIEEPGLLDRLRANLPAQMTLEEDAHQLREMYREVLEEAGESETPPAAVVLNYRSAEDTVLAVRSLASSSLQPDPVIVVDNASGDDSVAYLSDRLDGVELVASDDNLGFSGGCNLGLRRALEGGAGSVLLLNADAVVAADCVARLHAVLEANAEVGLAGALTLHRADPSRIATGGMRFNRFTGRMRHLLAGEPYDPVAPPPTRPVDALSGCAVLIRREVLERVGLLDEEFFFTFEDLEFCLRARRAGFLSVCVGDAVAYHQGSRSIGPRSPARLYYATRNHLLAARRGAPLPFFLSIPRAKLIVAYNLAHALTCGWVSAPQAAAEVARGTWDHVCRRYGPASRVG